VVRKSSKPEQGDAWVTTLRLLTRRDYGTGELRRKLLGKGFTAEAVEAAITRGSDLGYLDDARYVESLSRRLQETGRAVGPRLVVELRRRGLPDDLIRTAQDEARGAGGEESVLRALISRRFPNFDFLAADERERRRVVFFLQRRGFPLDRILNELKRNDP
jgi:regulatory protein